jgi:hypothetical protein
MKRMLLAGAFVVAGSIFAGCGPGYGSAYVRYASPARASQMGGPAVAAARTFVAVPPRLLALSAGGTQLAT